MKAKRKQSYYYKDGGRWVKFSIPYEDGIKWNLFCRSLVKEPSREDFERFINQTNIKPL